MNPFNPSTTIEFQIPNCEFVTLTIHNILGEAVVTLVSDKLNAGIRKYTLNGTNLASGIYYYQFPAGSPSKGLSRAESRNSGQRYRELKKIILIK